MSKPKIYVAAPWVNKAAAKAFRDDLVTAGYEVTSRWLDLHVGGNNDLATVDHARLKEEALNDIDDIINADILILLNSQDRGQESTGKAVETGVAIMTNKGIIVVGDRTNVFHYLGMPVVPTNEDAIALLPDYPWLPGQKPEHLMSDAEIEAELRSVLGDEQFKLMFNPDPPMSPMISE